MPDMINPEFTKKKEHIIWKDELCASCLNTGNCPLIQCLHNHIILTHSGIHVSRCDNYAADESSDYYIPPDANMEVIMQVNVAALEQQIDLLNKTLKGINDVSG